MGNRAIITSLLVLACLWPGEFFGQGQVKIEISSVNIFSTCFDVSKEKDLMYGLNINGEGEEYFAFNSICFDSFPAEPWVFEYTCPRDIPDSLEICFEIFENDGLIFTCQVFKSCPAEVCMKIPLPKQAGMVSEVISIDQSNDSWGNLNLTISNNTTIDLANDELCAAIELGTLAFEDSLGNDRESNFQNICATGDNEPNPLADGSFENDAGVWFTFTTDADPSSFILINGASDPESTGDPIDLELAVYEAPNGTCDPAELLFVKGAQNFEGNDIELALTCPQPNTRFYILVDGTGPFEETIRGHFGLKVSGGGIRNGSDAVCDAEQLAGLSEGLATSALVSNFCSAEDNSGVWFEFAAPFSGNVNIAALVTPDFSSVDLEVAVFELGAGNCDGQLELLEQADSNSLSIGCLYPGETYYAFVKGTNSNEQGVFNLTIEDAGLQAAPSSNTIDTLCFGEVYSFGDSVYTTTGSYLQRIPQERSCDSLAYLDLLILDSLRLSFELLRPASNLGIADAQARILVTGGSGDYTTTWCDGTQGDLNVRLVGGDTCCVEVIDRFGCVSQICIPIPYLDKIVLDSFAFTAPNCSDTKDGSLSFFPKGGNAPYLINLKGPLPCENCTLVKNRVDSTVQFNNLAAGDYEIFVRTEFQDSIYTFEMPAPAPLEIAQTSYQAISCRDGCDGAISVNIAGGTGPYRLDWGDGFTQDRTQNGLCAGNASLLVEDSLGCRFEAIFEFDNPPSLEVNIELDQGVSCPGAQDGALTAKGNQSNLSYLWSTGDRTPSVTNLDLGAYTLTVTNSLGCTSTAERTLSTFARPFSVSVSDLQPVSCSGDQDAILLARTTNPNYTYDYRWSNGYSGVENAGLAAGNYSLTVTNELGCRDSSSFILEDPLPIEVSFGVKDIDCIGGPASGRLNISSVSGGSGNFLFSIDGNRFVAVPELNYIAEGSYSLTVKDARGCAAEFPFVLEGPPDVKVDIPSSLEIKLGESFTIEPETNITDLEFFWSEANQVIATTADLVQTARRSTAYTVQAFDPVSGCSAFDTLQLLVDRSRRVYIPNAFSPNEDGYNDRFTIFGDVDVVKINQLEIYDRFGSKVYTREEHPANEVTSGWNGTLANGIELPNGVYIYWAEIEFIDGEVEVFKGEVFLLR